MENKPVTGYRLQIIGLDPDLRANFLSLCKKNGISGSGLLKPECLNQVKNEQQK